MLVHRQVHQGLPEVEESSHRYLLYLSLAEELDNSKMFRTNASNNWARFSCKTKMKIYVPILPQDIPGNRSIWSIQRHILWWKTKLLINQQKIRPLEPNKIKLRTRIRHPRVPKIRQRVVTRQEVLIYKFPVIILPLILQTSHKIMRQEPLKQICVD